MNKLILTKKCEDQFFSCQLLSICERMFYNKRDCEVSTDVQFRENSHSQTGRIYFT